MGALELDINTAQHVACEPGTLGDVVDPTGRSPATLLLDRAVGYSPFTRHGVCNLDEIVSGPVDHRALSRARAQASNSRRMTRKDLAWLFHEPGPWRTVAPQIAKGDKT